MKDKEDIYDHVHGRHSHRTIKVLDQGYVRLIETWGRGDAGVPEAGIVEAARQSTQGNFRGWDKWFCGSCSVVFDSKADHHCESPKWSNDEKLLGYLFNSKPQHATPFEFAGMVIEVQAPIFVFREWHRHRTQSYNEMSARYAPLPDMNYMPDAERCLIVNTTNKQAGALKGSQEVTHEVALEWLKRLQESYAKAEEVYQFGLAWGLPKEVARVCVPVGRYSRMRASTCLRNWLAFLTLRSDPGAQWEIRQFADAAGQIIAEQFSHTWELFSNRK